MTKTLAIVLLAAGILALVYGGFSYTKETNKAKVGPIEINVLEFSSTPINRSPPAT